MRLFYLAFTLALTTTVSFSQESSDAILQQTTRDRINFSNFDIPRSGTLYGIKGEPGKLIGDVYLDTTWQAGNLKFYGRINAANDSLMGVPVRLDLMKSEVEIRARANDVRVAPAPMVRYVDMNNRIGSSSRYINVREYRGDADALSGFFEQVVVGKLDLLLHPSVYVQKANFNAALNTGTKDDELVKKTDWYIGQNKRATKFSPGKKSVLALMNDKKDQITAFLKTTDPDLKSRSGLMSVMAYYNSL